MKNKIQRIMRRFFPVTDREVMDFCQQTADKLQTKAPKDVSAFCEINAWSNMTHTPSPTVRVGYASAHNCQTCTSNESLENALAKLAANTLP